MKTEKACIIIITGCAIVSLWIRYKAGIFAGHIRYGHKVKEYEKITK